MASILDIKFLLFFIRKLIVEMNKVRKLKFTDVKWKPKSTINKLIIGIFRPYLLIKLLYIPKPHA